MSNNRLNKIKGHLVDDIEYVVQRAEKADALEKELMKAYEITSHMHAELEYLRGEYSRLTKITEWERFEPSQHRPALSKGTSHKDHSRKLE